MEINGVNLDRFIELEGQVVEPVPEDERRRYRFWRAAHLGKIALNFMDGKPHLNPGDRPAVAHFTHDYAQARAYAGSFYNKKMPRTTQFSPEDRQALNQVLGVDDFTPPCMVLALRPDITFLDLELATTWGGGFKLERPLTMDDIDPHSRQAIEDIFYPELS